MAPRRYLNFDLLLDQEGEGSYQALVTGSPLGETPSVRFRLPFDATTLENLLLKLDPGRSGTRRVGASPQQQAAMDFGGPLFEAIFSNELLLAWSRSQDEAREQGDGLRLRLRLNDAPAIAGLPWELLYDERVNAFIAQSERTPVVRFLDLPSPPRPISVDGPLRVLVVISSPTDLEELDVEAEWGRIQEALAPRLDDRVVQIDRLPEATLTELGRWLRRHPTHVIHFVGHGDFDERLGEGVIYFQDSRGRSKAVTSSVLGPFLRDHDPLRMVVLNACRSARTDMRDPFGGMAQGLVQQDATAVIAMQFPISDRAAVAFTGAFYGALVDGLPVDQASSSARKALLADFADEWATPVLFLRAPDGDIFRQVHAPEDDDATQVDAPPVDAPTVVEPTQPEPTQPEPART
ncbi:CHAT domain-containing protein [Nocardioides sp.]|uniref:CHAT domain-containing protein n=1 Tax=Nocardioides sp. TaxID=35761 RepID=UPI0035279ADA